MSIKTAHALYRDNGPLRMGHSSFLLASSLYPRRGREGVTRYVTRWLTLESLGDLFGITWAIFAAWFKAHAFSRFFCLVENTV